MLAVALLAACATDQPDTSAALVAPANAASAAAPAPPYVLTKREQGLDCKKLTGEMKLRIIQMRGTVDRKQTSEVGRTMQQVVTPVLGGTTRGADPTADAAGDRAKLEAFNRQLAAKKCKTLDIDAELRGEAAPAGAAAAQKK